LAELVCLTENQDGPKPLDCIRANYQPQPWGRHIPFYQNAGTGIGYRF